MQHGYRTRRPDESFTQRQLATALHEKPRCTQRLRKFAFDARSVAALDVLQVQRRPAQYLKSTPQHAAGSPNARLVLVEALVRAISAHSHIDGMRLITAIAVIEQHQVDIRATAATWLEARGDFIDERQPFYVTHGKPMRNRARGSPPQPLEYLINADRQITPHP